MTDFDETKFPHRPSEYGFTDHFRNDVVHAKEQMPKDNIRHVTWERTFHTIRHGKLQKADGNADAEFMRQYKGVRNFVLVGYDNHRDKPIVVTGWMMVHDPNQAIKSGRWSEQQLRDINEFNNGNSLEEDFGYPL